MARCFVAAAEAAQDGFKLWPHEPMEDDRPVGRLRTQRRWVRQAGLLLGLASKLPRRTREVVAELLGVAGTLHHQAAARWAAARSIRERSRAVMSILALLELDGAVVWRLLAAGSLTGAIGPAYVCQPRTGRLFPAGRTPAPGYGRSRPPPTHEIGCL